MPQTATDQSTISSDFNAMPDTWRPGWTTPASIITAIASGIALYAAAVISCLLAFAAIFGMVYCLFGNLYIQALEVALLAICPLVGFLIYTPGRHRRIIAIVIAIIFALAFALNFVTDMSDIIILGIIGAFLLHGSALSGIALGKYSGRIASPYRWREIHLKNNQCPRCRYDIRKLPEPRCPECGETFEAGLMP